jgi:hypothetical protein
MVAARYGSIVAAVGAAALVTFVTARAAPEPAAVPCANRPTPTISSQVPADVCIPDGFTDIAVEYFDDYSWRAFIALVWPAASDHRGMPASRKAITAGGPRVFETYKPAWEIFHSDGSAPKSGFDTYDAAASNPCGVSARYGDLIIGSVSGIDDIGQAGAGALDAPLVAQNGRYVRTLTSFNQVEFDHIIENRFFLRSQLPQVPRPRPERPVIEFPMGSIAVKTAWIDVTGLPAALVKRFYTRPALVKRAGGEGCAPATVGLVGLHIAQKTPSRPQWIWSSFEQKDAVPPGWADSPGAYVLHDGSRAAMPQTNPLSLVPLASEPVRPFNVVRDAGAQILTRTELTNYSYQGLLAGTPWQYYRLVVTQWPRLEGNQAAPIPASLDGGVANTFPGLGAFSAFANVTMETFAQKGVQTGCMNCHNRSRMSTDFMWTVFDHAYPSRLAPAASGIGGLAAREPGPH